MIYMIQRYKVNVHVLCVTFNNKYIYLLYIICTVHAYINGCITLLI